MPESTPSRTFWGGSKGSGALAAVYAALFVAPGFYLPFFPVFLASLGFSPEAIGIAIGIPMGMRLLANPVAGILSDRWGRPRRFLAVLGLGSASAFVLMAILPGTHEDGFGLWHRDGVLAFAGHNLFKHAPSLGELLADAALGGAPDPLLSPPPG